MKKPFVTYQQIKKITEEYPRLSICMMKRESGRMPPDCRRRLPGIKALKNISR